MAITTEFPGSSLPSGWAFHSPTGNGSTSVHDDGLYITFPVGASTMDSITQQGSSQERSIGVRHALSAGDQDIAIQIDTDIGDQKAVSVNLVVYDDTDFARARWGIYKGNSGTLEAQNGQAPSFYHASRPASGGGNGAAAYNVGTNSGTNDIMTGMPAWMRYTYDSVAGIWTAYYSTDGFTWITPTSRTQPFTPGYFKIGIGSTPGSDGGTVRIGQVIDVAAYGSTDLRGVVPSRSRQTVVTINGTDGSLPAEFVDDSDKSSNPVATTGISWTGTALRFADDPTLDADIGGWARIRYVGTEYAECGVLMRMANVGGGNSACYGTLGLIHDLPDVSTTPVAASAATRTISDGRVVVTVDAGHGLTVNQLIVASGFSDISFNGKWSIVETTATTITWYHDAADATTGAGTITPATRSPIDQYVRGGGYALEINSGTTRRPIRVDDPTGTNVGSSIQSTGLDEMPYFWMKNYEGTEYDMGSGGTRMFRLERIGRRFRVREWADAGSLAASLAAEPSTWDYIDAQDEVNAMTLGPTFVQSHNGIKAGAVSNMDVYYMEYYQLTASVGPSVRVKQSGSWENASAIRAKVSGSWEDGTIQSKSGGSWS